MLTDLMGTFVTHESEVKGERVARAAQQRAEAGQANAGVAYGWHREYDTDERGRTTGFRDVVDDAQANVVREAVGRVLAGEGLRRLTSTSPYCRAMTWVSTGDEQAGLPHILRAHSANKDALRGHLQLYRAVMFGESGLSRTEREAMAVAVSAVNDCHY